MKILSYPLKKRLQMNQRRHKAFNYHYYVSDMEEFQQKVERWSGKNQLLQEVAEAIASNNYKWHENPTLNNERDLAGTEIKNFDTVDCLGGFEYINFSYCSFEACQIQSPETEGVLLLQPAFRACKLNNSHFKNCKFRNIFFSDGEFNHVVFYNCDFEHVEFNKNHDGHYNYLFFQNCTFKNVNFSFVDMHNFCFWGDCKFTDCEYDYEFVSLKKSIGAEIIDKCANWDNDSYKERVENHYIGGPYNKIEIEYYNDAKKKLHIIKYASVVNCLKGLINFYNYLYSNEDQQGEHHAYLSYNYIYRDLKDKKKNLEVGISKNLKFFISKYIFGYGVKAQNPLITFVVMILIFSLFYLFTGVIYIERLIQRPFQFQPSAFIATIKDLDMCLYFSVITSTTIGYGDIRPATEITMLIAGIQGILGILLMTMFTVVFGRRFFK